MHTLNTQANWQSHKKPLHWLKHSLLPLLLILIFLCLPKPWITELLSINSAIEIELIDNQSQKPEPIKTVPPEPQPNEPEPQVTTPEPVLKTLNIPEMTEPAPQQPVTTDVKSIDIEQTAKPAVNAVDVMQMIQNRTSIEVPAAFQTRTQPATDFYIPKQEIENWLADIPFLDESVDKPQLEMRFYAEGIEGSVEKFFDKITLSKTFTTQYGTQIECALVGVLAVCGWK